MIAEPIMTATAPVALVDYAALHVGGMPAYEQALRALEAGHLELADRFAAHLAVNADRGGACTNCPHVLRRLHVPAPLAGEES